MQVKARYLRSLILALVGVIAVPGQSAAATETTVSFPAECKQLPLPVDCLYY